ncbi:sin3 histone deacetylase corepressor complex component SDS3 [Camelus ferus]|nr:sin3 histone deacetylase corepressor complex component SDS3 [Camelus ferus]
MRGDSHSRAPSDNLGTAAAVISSLASFCGVPGSETAFPRGTLQEYQKRMKKLDQQYKERIRNAVNKSSSNCPLTDHRFRCTVAMRAILQYVSEMSHCGELFLQLETEQVERNYIKEKKAAVKEFEDKKVELKENLIAELEEKKKMIENEKLTMELTGESPAQRFEARIEDGKLYYDKRWYVMNKRRYHKSQAIYLESKDNQKLSCVISSVGANEIWVRKTSDSTKMRIYLGQLQRGLFVIRRRWGDELDGVIVSGP